MKILFKVYVETLNNASISRSVYLQSIKVSNIELLQRDIKLQYSQVDNFYFADDIVVDDTYANQEAEYRLLIEDTLPTDDPNYPQIVNKFTIIGKLYLKYEIFKDYLYCKRLFCQLTGRYDLFADPLKNDYRDIKGIVELLFNSGQKWIETQLDIGSLMGFMYYRLPANNGTIEFKNIRYVKKVVELRDDRYIELPFCAQAIGLVPEQREDGEHPLSEDIRERLGYPNYYYTADGLLYRAIVVEPVDYDRDIIIQCYYYSKRLMEDKDMNFWTVEYPDVLVKSAIRELEIYMGNFDKAQMYEIELMKRLNEIRKDFVAHTYGSIKPNQMVMEGRNIWLPQNIKYQLF